MKLYSKKPTKVFAERCWSTTWPGLRWTVHVHFEKRLLGFIKWGEICQMAGPFLDKQEAKREVKRLRKKIQSQMSKTLKQKVDHIFYKKDGTPNLRVPLKLRWSFINRLRRQNFDRAEERALLSLRRDKMSKADMKRQIKEL